MRGVWPYASSTLLMIALWATGSLYEHKRNHGLHTYRLQAPYTWSPSTHTWLHITKQELSKNLNWSMGNAVHIWQAGNKFVASYIYYSCCRMCQNDLIRMLQHHKYCHVHQVMLGSWVLLLWSAWLLSKPQYYLCHTTEHVLLDTHKGQKTDNYHSLGLGLHTRSFIVSSVH